MIHLLVAFAAVAVTVAWFRVAMLIDRAVKRRSQIHFLTHVLRPHLLRLRDLPVERAAIAGQLTRRPRALLPAPAVSSESSVCA